MLNIWSINALLINEKNAYGPHDKIKFMFINQNIICSRISYEVIKWTDSKNV